MASLYVPHLLQETQSFNLLHSVSFSFLLFNQNLSCRKTINHYLLPANSFFVRQEPVYYIYTHTGIASVQASVAGEKPGGLPSCQVSGHCQGGPWSIQLYRPRSQAPYIFGHRDGMEACCARRQGKTQWPRFNEIRQILSTKWLSQDTGQNGATKYLPRQVALLPRTRLQKGPGFMKTWLQ